MTYELWDTICGNVIGHFATAAEATAAVLEAADLNDDGYIDDLFLLRADAIDAVVAIAGGPDLLAWARNVDYERNAHESGVPWA